jgi:hypothetical protein
VLADARSLTVTEGRLDRLSRELAAGGIGGVLVGVPAGLVARLIMKLSALAAGPSTQGVHTENGNVVGAFTLEGTLALVIFGGLAPAVTGGIVYVAVRPLLASFRRWRTLAFALFLLALAGSVALDPFNFDFIRFGPAALNVGMFCALFLFVGVALALVIEPVLVLLERGRIGLVAIGFLVAGLGTFVLFVVGIGTLWSWLTAGQPFTEGRAATLLSASVAIAAVARLRGLPAISYAALGVPFAVGVWLTGTSIVALLR